MSFPQRVFNRLALTPNVADRAVAKDKELCVIINAPPHVGVKGIKCLPTAKLGAEHGGAPARKEHFSRPKKAERVAPCIRWCRRRIGDFSKPRGVSARAERGGSHRLILLSTRRGHLYARVSSFASVDFAGHATADAAVRLGGIGEQRCALKGESWGRKGGRASPAIAVSAPAARRPAVCTWGAKRPISPAAQESFQLPTNKGDHAIDASLSPPHGVRCPEVAATAMKDGL